MTSALTCTTPNKKKISMQIRALAVPLSQLLDNSLSYQDRCAQTLISQHRRDKQDMDNTLLSFLPSPWDMIACRTFRGRLIYETLACFFMTCLIAFSAIGHHVCQDHKNSHLHRIA